MSYESRTREGITGRGSHNGGHGDLVILEGFRDRYEWLCLGTYPRKGVPPATWLVWASTRLIRRHVEHPCIKVLANCVCCQSEEKAQVIRALVASRFLLSLSLSIITAGNAQRVVHVVVEC
jgi:hypothetical protein